MSRRRNRGGGGDRWRRAGRWRFHFEWFSLGVLLLASCRQQSPEVQAIDRVEGYADLVETRATHDLWIQDELARIEAEQGLPLQLQEHQDSIPEFRDLTPVFTEAFESDWKLNSALSSLERLWPAEGLDFGDDLSRAHRLVVNHQEIRTRLREALRDPQRKFKADFITGLGADLRWLTVAEILARWDGVEIDLAVKQGQTVEAADLVSGIFRLAVRLDEVPQLNARLLSAKVRRIGLQGIQRVAMSSEVSLDQLERLHELLVTQRSLWPEPRRAWIGERALGLHVFEMVRQGDYLSLLDEQEMAELEEKREVTDRALVVQKNVDVDERFFLETMSRLLETLDEPYAERRAMWDERFEELDARRGAPEFPRVSADILLVGFSTAQDVLARDWACCEAWRMALAASLALPDTADELNPATGQWLRVEWIDPVQLQVAGLHPDDADLIPKLPRRVSP